MIISKARALVLVFISFCLAFTFMLTSPHQSRALVPLVIPVAKIAGGLVLSYALEQGITTALNKSSLPDSSPVKKYGKWGAKLTGSRASLGLGLLGGSIALATEVDWSGEGDPPDNAEDGDGYRMPRDFQDDVSSIGTSPGEGRTGSIASFTIDRIEWRMHPGYSNLYVEPYQTVYAVGSCRIMDSMHEKYKSTWCNENGYVQGWAIEATCYSAESGSFYTERGRLGSPGKILSAGRIDNYPLCGDTIQSRVPDPIFSVRIIEHADGLTYPDRRGVAPLLESYNPNFQIPDAEPSVSVTAETVCTDGAGNSQTVSKTTAGADVVPIAQCPVGWVPVETNWTAQTTSAGGDVNREWLGGVQQSTSEQYPECAPGECTRVIKVDDQVCDATRPECADWLKTTAPDRVKCEYGPYALGLEDCADLEHLHKTTWGIVPNPDPAASPAWLPANPDGTPDYTRVDQDWAPDENINPWYTPVTPGKWSTGSPSTDPSSTPTTVPGTPVEPGTGTEPDTDAPNTGFPSSGANPDNDSQNCIAGMWSWNPVDWIYTPVKCALQWAFVPKPGQASQLMTNFKTEYAGTGLGTWSGVPASIISEFPTGEAGCKGPAMTVPQSLGGKTYYPLDACEEPMAQYAQMSKALISLLVVVFGGFSMANTISVAATGYPLFRREQQAVSV